ncbi:SprT family zinc-dependent metalloprotease [Desulfonatronospira sp.]|uniref:M48 family metallopeptidase n=1 Tax=Desulfonatronospira sp. TaxID=1962951 RepID=UPI0025BF379A|nr:SprT family zinc-dependent metalloprotease [Desulfonatronospira sp.]
MYPEPVYRIQVEEISAEVVFKRIRHMHIRVYPPHGVVRISAPLKVRMDRVRAFMTSRLDWIRKRKRSIQESIPLKPSKPLNGVLYPVWGQKYSLLTVERDRPPFVKLRQKSIILAVRPGTGLDKKEALLNKWFREQVKDAASAQVDKWSSIMRVKVNKIFVQAMKTKWGTCNMDKGNIRLNTDLVHHPPRCLEYLVVHELAHLLEPCHNRRFYTIMDDFFPQWRLYREMLNG